MLGILGEPCRFCDGVSRRSFLKIGGLAFGGLSMSEIARAQAATYIGEATTKTSSRSHKAIIMVFLPGGPPHQDMFDLKPHAPAEVRGEFDPIETNVSGIRICELMPRTAAIMDKLAIIRSVIETPNDHAAYHCLTGRALNGPKPAGGWPALGSVLSKVDGPVASGVPPFVGLAAKMKLETWSDCSPGFLGAAHGPFKPSGEMRGDLVLNGINSGRLHDRQRLLESFDRFHSAVDNSGQMDGLDWFNQQALSVLTSSALLEALDPSREDERIRERYGSGGPKLRPSSGDELDATGDLEHFLIARRLVEAGVRCVMLNFGKWDAHSDNFRRAKNNLPLLDQGIAALVTDLHERGLDKDVTVVVWGEFGRTPRINVNAGRDHWPNVMSVLLAGGGMRTGQVIGETDRIAGEAVTRRVRFQEVFATLYHNLGIDVEHTQLTDLNGRPHYLLDQRTPVHELI